MTQVLLPKNVDTSPFQLYQKIKDLLTPKKITGKAQQAKLGSVLQTEEGELYVLDQSKNGWTEEQLNQTFTLRCLVIERDFEENLVNEKGEYKAGLVGAVNYIINPEIIK